MNESKDQNNLANDKIFDEMIVTAKSILEKKVLLHTDDYQKEKWDPFVQVSLEWYLDVDFINAIEKKLLMF